MATDNPALIERLGEIAKTAQNLGRGEKSRYLQTKADELGMSVSTLYRKLESVAVKPARKARSDKGEMYRYNIPRHPIRGYTTPN